MKTSKILLIFAGIVVIVVLTVGITIGVERIVHRRAFEKRMPYLTDILGKERPRDLLETIKIVRAIEVLDMNEEQIGKVISRWGKLNNIREEHNKIRKEKLEEIEKLLKAKASSSELQAVISELNGLDDKFQSDYKALRNEIDNALTIEQQAKLILFERDFHRQMQMFLENQPKTSKQNLRGRQMGKELREPSQMPRTGNRPRRQSGEELGEPSEPPESGNRQRRQKGGEFGPPTSEMPSDEIKEVEQI